MAKRKSSGKRVASARSAPDKPHAKSVARKSMPRGGETRIARTSPATPAELAGTSEAMAKVQDVELPPFPIVGLGASAGGLEALSEFLAALTPNPCVAIVIVQHLAPKPESMLPHLLSGATALSVTEVTDGMVVERNHVYVIPPNQEMEIFEGRLRLMPRPISSRQFNPIDAFFVSLAAYAQWRAIGVVLSGSASDGANGLREIAAVAGITISQDPETAKFDSMPRAAIATGLVDLVLNPTEIAHEVGRIGQQLAAMEEAVPPLAPAALEAAETPSMLQFGRIFALLRKTSGVDFTHYKHPTIRRRLHRRMVLQKISNIEDYIRFLENDQAELTQLYQDLLIHVTRFFRDRESFETLEREVFPELAATIKEGRPIRIWVPGCSTGEEVYSIAIALLDFVGDIGPNPPIQFFGTDVSERMIEKSRWGAYTEAMVADVSRERLRRYFSRVDGHYRISKGVRDLCIFARQDVTRDPPFSKLDLIVCRNVLIYLDSMLQKRLMHVFHYSLRPNGFLVLGAAETVGASSDLFTLIDKKHKIYRKKPGSVAVRDAKFSAAHLAPTAVQPGTAPRAPSTATNVQAEANRIVLSRYAPPGVVVDSDLRIVQFRGQTGNFLEPAPGEASLNLLKMAREGLLAGLRSAVREANKRDASVRRERMHVLIAGQMHEVDLEVVPISSPEGKHFLVLFHDRAEESRPLTLEPAGRPSKEKPARGARKKKETGDVTRLQQELAASREYLQSIIQDMEAANEELQSANEEILSSNEELQSTNEELDTAKEELQSTNEELNTVNEELQARNEELSRVNSDLVNLLASVQIGIVMVGGDLRIRRFTPMAEKILNLIPGDVGRPISDIKPKIKCPDLEGLIADAVDTVTIQESEAQDSQGNWYLLRIRPYKNVDNRIDGAVIALFDVDSSRRYPAERAAAIDAVGALLEASNEPTLVLDGQNRVQAANSAFRGAARMEDVLGRPVFEVPLPKGNQEALKRALDELIESGPAADAAPADAQLHEDGRADPGGRATCPIRAKRQMIGNEMITVVVFPA